MGKQLDLAAPLSRIRLTKQEDNRWFLLHKDQQSSFIAAPSEAIYHCVQVETPQMCNLPENNGATYCISEKFFLA